MQPQRRPRTSGSGGLRNPSPRKFLRVKRARPLRETPEGDQRALLRPSTQRWKAATEEARLADARRRRCYGNCDGEDDGDEEGPEQPCRRPTKKARTNGMKSEAERLAPFHQYCRDVNLKRAYRGERLLNPNELMRRMMADADRQLEELGRMVGMRRRAATERTGSTWYRRILNYFWS